MKQTLVQCHVSIGIINYMYALSLTLGTCVRGVAFSKFPIAPDSSTRGPHFVGHENNSFNNLEHAQYRQTYIHTGGCAQLN
jgi:hypothetical protein